MDMRTLPLYIILTLLVFTTSHFQTPGAIAGEDAFNSKLHDNQRLTSLIKNNEPLNEKDLATLKDHLKNFVTILGQKLNAAEKSTTMLFTPVRQMAENIITSPATSVSTDDNLYDEIKTILTEIGTTPVMAMIYEESRNSSKLPALATIQPDKGHGATYRSGESIRFAVKAFKDCYIRIFFISTQKDVPEKLVLQRLMFHPEPGLESVHLASGDTLILGEDGSFTVEPPYGRDLIIVVATELEVKTQTSSKGYPVTFPLDFGKVFVDIFGELTAEKLSFHSCFIESKPPQTDQTRITGILTEQEAQALRLEEQEWLKPPTMYRSIQAGPIIKVQLPTLKDDSNPTIEAQTPLDLKISFEQKDAPVDMETLQVVARKGFFSQSLTNRVKKYVKGTVLEAKELDFPKGKFRIQVEIADVNGILTTAEYRLKIE